MSTLSKIQRSAALATALIIPAAAGVEPLDAQIGVGIGIGIGAPVYDPYCYREVVNPYGRVELYNVCAGYGYPYGFVGIGPYFGRGYWGGRPGYAIERGREGGHPVQHPPGIHREVPNDGHPTAQGGPHGGQVGVAPHGGGFHGGGGGGFHGSGGGGFHGGPGGGGHR